MHFHVAWIEPDNPAFQEEGKAGVAAVPDFAEAVDTLVCIDANDDVARVGGAGAVADRRIPATVPRLLLRGRQRRDGGGGGDDGAEVRQKFFDLDVGVIARTTHRKRFERHMAAVAGTADDRDKPLHVGRGRIGFAAGRFLDLPVYRVGCDHRDVGVGIGGEIFSGVDQGGAPLAVDPAEKTEVFRTGG